MNTAFTILAWVLLGTIALIGLITCAVEPPMKTIKELLKDKDQTKVENW